MILSLIKARITLFSLSLSLIKWITFSESLLVYQLDLSASDTKLELKIRTENQSAQWMVKKLDVQRAVKSV